MKSEPKVDTADTLAPGQVMPKSSSRRRLLRAGIGASPVILSVVSQPVRAALTEKACRSASALASFNGNIATSAAPMSTCKGNGPDTWKGTNALGLPANSSDYFYTGVNSYTISIPAATPGGTPTTVTNPTIIQVIQYGGGIGQRNTLALYIAAAKLNFGANKTPAEVATIGVLDAMWRDTEGGGTHLVNGTPWSMSDVINWLATTFINS